MRRRLAFMMMTRDSIGRDACCASRVRRYAKICRKGKGAAAIPASFNAKKCARPCIFSLLVVVLITAHGNRWMRVIRKVAIHSGKNFSEV